MKKVVILGAGMMGHVMAKELIGEKDYENHDEYMKPFNDLKK